MRDFKGDEIEFDDADLTQVEDSGDVVVINFNENAKDFGYISLSLEEIEKLYLTLKTK